MRLFLIAAMALGGTVGFSAERVFDFGTVKLGETPPGFRSTVAGSGPPGEWKVVLDQVPSPLTPLTTLAQPEKQAVLAQLSRDRADERFPMLIFDEETFTDFRFTARFKLVDGAVEQMAGIAFRIQDERNYYYLRASGLGNTFYFYVVKDGRRGPAIGPKMEIKKNAWHELAVECKGQEIRAFLNGTLAIPPMQDATFGSGRIGFWTKSDAVTHFMDARVVYTPHETLAQSLVRETMEKYPRLLGLKIIGRSTNASSSQPMILASNEPGEAGQAVGSEVLQTIGSEVTFYSKNSRSLTVTMPLHDRNGETAAAVRVVMKPFPGQTAKNALVRAMPIVRGMESRIRSARELVQ